MEKYKKGDIVLVVDYYLVGKIVTTEVRYSNVTGHTKDYYVVRSHTNKYTHYYCEEDKVVKIEGNFLLTTLFAIDDED